MPFWLSDPPVEMFLLIIKFPADILGSSPACLEEMDSNEILLSAW